MGIGAEPDDVGVVLGAVSNRVPEMLLLVSGEIVEGTGAKSSPPSKDSQTESLPTMIIRCGLAESSTIGGTNGKASRKPKNVFCEGTKRNGYD